MRARAADKTGVSDFSRGAVPAVIMRMSLPLIAAGLVNVLYNIVDRIYIGHIPGSGSAALTGVGIALPVVTMLAAFAGLFGQGGAPLFSIARGRGDEEGAARILGNAMTLLMCASVALIAVFQLSARWVLSALGAGKTTLGYALDYLRVYLWGTPFVLVTLGMNHYVNAQGFARRGMLTVMLGAVVNLILDPVFIFTLGMGVRGAALATVISQAVSAAWCLAFLTGRLAVIPLRARYMPLRRKVVARILSLGITNFIAQATNSAVQAVANRQLSVFGGDLYVGSMTIINSMRTVLMEFVRGMGGGTQPVIGFNFGAGKKERVLECIRFNTAVSVGFMLLLWAILEAAPRFFVGIFTSDEALAAVAVRSMRVYFCGICFMAAQTIGQSTFQGLGMARQAVVYSLLRKIVIVVPLMLLLPRMWGLGADGVFWSEPISDLLGGGICFLAMILTVYLPIRREAAEESICRN